MNELILATYGVLFVGLLWFIRQKISEYDKHLGDSDLHQTERERQALADLFEARFKAHEELDDRREDDHRKNFDALFKSLDGRLIEILSAVHRRNEER